MKKLLLVTLLLILQSCYAEEINLEKDCNIIPHLQNNWLRYVENYASLSELNDVVYIDDFTSEAKSMISQSSTIENELTLSALIDRFVLLAAWQDSRIREIHKLKQVCDTANKSAEVIIHFRDVRGKNSHKVIPMRLDNGNWKRGYTLTSGYSYILKKDVIDILKSE